MCLAARQGLLLAFLWCRANIRDDLLLWGPAQVFERFRLELNRHKQRPFLEAVAAACALVATADGEVSFSERTRLDSVIENLSQLRLFDPHEVVDAFDEHVARLADDEDGVAAMLEVIRAGTRQDGAADLLLRISAVMSLADGRDSADEHAVMLKISAALELPQTAVDDAYAAIQA